MAQISNNFSNNFSNNSSTVTYADFDCCKLAYEIGFRDCTTDTVFLGQSRVCRSRKFLRDVSKNVDWSKGVYDRCTQDELKDWLRVKHKLAIAVLPYNQKGMPVDWYYSLVDLNYKTSKDFQPYLGWSEKSFDSYEIAFQQVLMDCLNLIKLKNVINNEK